MKKVRCDDCNESFAAQQIFEIDGHKLCNKCLFGNRNNVSASTQQDAEYVSVLRSDLQYLVDVFIEGGWAEDEDLPVIDRIHTVLRNRN